MSISNIISGLPLGTHTVRISHKNGIQVDGVACNTENRLFNMIGLLSKLDVLDWDASPKSDHMEISFYGTGLDIVAPNKVKVKV